MIQIIYIFIFSFASLAAQAKDFVCVDSGNETFLSGSFNSSKTDILDLTIYEKESVKMLYNAACAIEPSEVSPEFKFKSSMYNYLYSPDDHKGLFDVLFGSTGEEDDVFGWDTVSTYVSVGYLRFDTALDNARDLCFHSVYLTSSVEELKTDTFRLKFKIAPTLESDDPRGPYKKELLQCSFVN